jgi:hypothetical protein
VTRPPLPSRAIRLAIFTAPIVVRVVGRSYPWAGCHIADTVPIEGRRVWKLTPEDEEAVVRLREED